MEWDLAGGALKTGPNEEKLEIGDPKCIEHFYGSKKIIIATGSSPVSLPTLPFEGDIIVPTDDIFKNYSIPDRVFIMGAGGYSCELSYLAELSRIELKKTLNFSSCSCFSCYRWFFDLA